MASNDTDLTDMQRTTKSAMAAHWRFFMLQGVVLIILGVLAVVEPVVATFAIDIFIGWLFLISGVVGVVAVFSSKDIPAFLWSLVTAALSIGAGVLLICKPVEGILSLTLVLAAFFIAEGLFQIVTSIAYRALIVRSWGWMLASGVADLILAAIIILGWQITAIWVLGLLAGINLFTSGLAIVLVGFGVRDFVHPIAAPLAGAQCIEEGVRERLAY